MYFVHDIFQVPHSDLFQYRAFVNNTHIVGKYLLS